MADDITRDLIRRNKKTWHVISEAGKRANLSRNIPSVEEDRERKALTAPPHQRVLVRRLDRQALHRPQGPDSGINAIIGRIPADDDDEEVVSLLEELS